MGSQVMVMGVGSGPMPAEQSRWAAHRAGERVEWLFRAYAQLAGTRSCVDIESQVDYISRSLAAAIGDVCIVHTASFNPALPQNISIRSGSAKVEQTVVDYYRHAWQDISDDILGQRARLLRPLRIERLADNGPTAPWSGRFLRALGGHSLMALPLRCADGKITGALCIVRTVTPDAFTEDDLLALGHVALHTAQILDGGVSGGRQELGEEMFRRALESAPNAMIIVDRQGKIELINAEAEHLFGYRRSELIGANIEILVPENLRKKHAQIRGRYQSDPRRRPMGFAHQVVARRRDGATIPVEIELNPLMLDSEGFVIAAIVDVSERRRGYEKQARLAAIVEASDDAILYVTADGVIRSWNRGAEEMFGYRADEAIGANVAMLAPVDRRSEIDEFLEQIAQGQHIMSYETVRLRKDGVPIDVSGSVAPIRDESGDIAGVSWIMHDITDAKRAADTVLASLREKEVLLKEVHHRVKNNLQVISSLLSLQAARIRDPEALAMFRESQDRVHAIALFHEKLYQAPDLSHIDLPNYFRSLTQSVVAAYGSDASHIRVEVRADGPNLDVSQALPCALIVNELVTNALKHGIHRKDTGAIRIEFRRDGDWAELSVSNDGEPFPAGIDVYNAKTLGLQLVTTLATQLGGTLLIQRVRPTRITIRFPIQSKDEAIDG